MHSCTSTLGFGESIKREVVMQMEVHFGKPVIARVRKCRLVVVKKKRLHDESLDNGSKA